MSKSNLIAFVITWLIFTIFLSVVFFWLFGVFFNDSEFIMHLGLSILVGAIASLGLCGFAWMFMPHR